MTSAKKSLLLQLLAMGGVAALTVTSCDQPKITCTAGHGEFALKYTKVSGSCMAGPGNVVGVQAYVKGMPGGRPQFLQPPMAMKPAELGDLLDQYAQPADLAKISSVGEFVDKEPGPDGFCKVGALTPAAVSLAPVPARTNAMGMMTPALPAMEVKYEWTDVKYYVTAANPGTQFSGRLKYTLNGCASEYDVVAMAPAVGCELTGADGKGTGMPDDTLCSPCPDLSKMRGTGSGIAPNIETVCDPDILFCVPKGPLPSLRPAIDCKALKPAALTSGGTAR